MSSFEKSSFKEPLEANRLKDSTPPSKSTKSRWWFQIFVIFLPIWEMIQFHEHIFQMGGSTTN